MLPYTLEAYDSQITYNIKNGIRETNNFL